MTESLNFLSIHFVFHLVVDNYLICLFSVCVHFIMLLIMKHIFYSIAGNNSKKYINA